MDTQNIPSISQDNSRTLKLKFFANNLTFILLYPYSRNQHIFLDFLSSFLLFSFFFSITFSPFVFSFLWELPLLTLFLYTTSFDFFFTSFLLFVFFFSSNHFLHLHNSKYFYPHTCFSLTHGISKMQRT